MTWMRGLCYDWVMSNISITLPDSCSVSEDEARLFLAMKLFEVGRLSCGQAARIAGYSKRTFMELLGKEAIAVFDHPAGQLADDLNHA